MPIAESVSTIADSLLAEFETQTPITRRFLERLPEDKLMWKPHERSMTAGQLALHLASVPGGIVRFAQTNPGQSTGFHFPQPESCEQVLAALDDSLAAARDVLPKFDDDAMKETWRLTAGDQEILALPREAFLGDIMFSHWYQHRGQFSVYLRLLNIAVPASWGPSADEAPLFMQAEKNH